MVWDKAAHQFSLGIMQSCLPLKRRVDFQKTVIQRLTIFIKNHFNNTKTLIN